MPYAFAFFQPSDGGDAAVANTHVGAIPGIASPIHYACITNEKVEVGCVHTHSEQNGDEAKHVADFHGPPHTPKKSKSARPM